MKRFIFVAFYLTASVISMVSALPSTVMAQKVYTVAEQQPEYPGGTTALSRYLAATIRVPSALSRKNYDTGPVAVRFIIDELGYVRDVRTVAKSFSKRNNRGMEKYMANIIEAVEKMPRWKPGEVGGRPVPVFYTLPIEINLQ